MSAEVLNKVRDRKRRKRARPLAFPPKLSLSLALDSRHCRSLPVVFLLPLRNLNYKNEY
jgi:hypothetical protein